MNTALARTSLVVLLCLLPAATQASSITLKFEGTVTGVQDPFGLVGARVTRGDPVHGSIRYDTATPDFYPTDPTRGTYFSPGWLRININGLGFHSSGVQVDVLNMFQPNTNLFQALVCCSAGEFGNPTEWPGSLPLFPFYRMLLFLAETMPPYSLLSSDALPVSLDLAAADLIVGDVTSGTSDTTMYQIQFGLTGLEPIPEPGTLALVGAGLAVGLARYRASRARRFQ
jgi:PEP-CTERM motif